MTRGLVKVVFLTLDEAIALHADQIERYGGRPGIRDIGCLQSALEVPAATFEAAGPRSEPESGLTRRVVYLR